MTAAAFTFDTPRAEPGVTVCAGRLLLLAGSVLETYVRDFPYFTVQMAGFRSPRRTGMDSM